MFILVLIIIVSAILVISGVYIAIKIKSFNSSLNDINSQNKTTEEGLYYVSNVLSTSVPTKGDLYNMQNSLIDNVSNIQNDLNTYTKQSASDLNLIKTGLYQNLGVSVSNANSTIDSWQNQFNNDMMDTVSMVTTETDVLNRKTDNKFDYLTNSINDNIVNMQTNLDAYKSQTSDALDELWNQFSIEIKTNNDSTNSNLTSLRTQLRNNVVFAESDFKKDLSVNMLEMRTDLESTKNKLQSDLTANTVALRTDIDLYKKLASSNLSLVDTKFNNKLNNDISVINTNYNSFKQQTSSNMDVFRNMLTTATASLNSSSNAAMFNSLQANLSTLKAQLLIDENSLQFMNSNMNSLSSYTLSNMNSLKTQVNNYATAYNSQFNTSNLTVQGTIQAESINLAPFTISSSNNNTLLFSSPNANYSFDSTGTSRQKNLQVDSCIQIGGNMVCKSNDGLKTDNLELTSFLYTRGGNSTYNASNLKTMFPSPLDGINYIRGDTEVSGNVTFDGNLNWGANKSGITNNSNILRIFNQGSSTVNIGFSNNGGSFSDVVKVDSSGGVKILGNLHICDATGSNCFQVSS